MKHWTDKNLKVGDRIINQRGQIGVVTWVSNGCAAYDVVSDNFDSLPTKDESDRPWKTQQQTKQKKK